MPVDEMDVEAMRNCIIELEKELKKILDTVKELKEKSDDHEDKKKKERTRTRTT